jgi:hypothetical protein
MPVVLVPVWVAVLVILVPVEPIVVVAPPAPVAYIFEVVAGVTRRVAVVAEIVDGAIEVPFGAIDTFAATAPLPRLGCSGQGAQ